MHSSQSDNEDSGILSYMKTGVIYCILPNDHHQNHSHTHSFHSNRKFHNQNNIKSINPKPQNLKTLKP